MQSFLTYFKNILTIILLLFATSLAIGQETPKTKLIVSVHKNSKGQIGLPYSDTLKINCDGGFQNDVLELKSGDKYFKTDTLNTDKLIGYSGSLKIPKTKGKQRIMVYLNQVYIGKLTVKKKFSEVHINKFDKQLNWIYINYRFIYL